MSQPGEIVLASYPYDDFSSQKVRPVLCLTRGNGRYQHVIVSYITSRISPKQLSSEMLLTKEKKGFTQTGLKVSSTVHLHKLVAIPEKNFKRRLGTLSNIQHQQIKKKLAELFELELIPQRGRVKSFSGASSIFNQNTL